MKTFALKNAAKKMMAAALGAVLSISTVAAPVLAAEESRVDKIIAGMSLRDKITQTLEPDFRKWGPTQESATDFTEMNDDVAKIIADYNFGSIILFANNVKTTEQSFELVKAMQSAAVSDGGIPMLIATDQEGGSVARLGSGCSLPGNMALGATFDPDNAYKAGTIIGSELSSLGINVDLAPVVDVNNNPNNPVIGLRSYGDDPVAVGEMAASEIAGLSSYDVIGCAKHFPGHGDTATDSHYGLPSVDKPKDVLLQNELMPYQVAIENGIEMIMTAHILYPQLDSSTLLSNKTGEQESLPATMSKAILTDLLKGELGFEGVVSTDAMNMQGIAGKWDQVQAVVNALNAGADVICMPTVLYSLEDLAALDAVIEGVEAAVEDGTLPESRLDDACRRILTLKEKHGILDLDPAAMDKEKALETVGGTDNRELERQIAAKAVTVIKNDNDVLPFDVKENEKVLLLTPFANEPVLIAMGFNRAKEAKAIPASASLEFVVFNGVSEITDDIKTKIDAADHVIIVSEVSNASRMGGKSWQSAGPLSFAAYTKETGKPCVVMSVDKPYDVQLYDDADAIIAVFGDKGSAADPTETLIGGATGTVDTFGPNMVAGTEVILGTFGANGKMPVNVNKYDPETTSYTDEVVYPRGYGLELVAKKDQPVAIDVQPEDSVVDVLNQANTVKTSSPEADAAYQWFVKNPGEADFAPAAQGKEYSVVLDDKTNGQQAFCRVSLPNGAETDTNTVTLTNTAIPAKAALAETAAKDVKTDGMTDASKAAYDKALAAAKDLLNKEDATAKELTEADDALEAAAKALDPKVTSATKEELKKLLASFKEENYTPESWKAFAPVLAQGADALNNKDLGENAAKAEIARINEAAKGLVKKAASGTKTPSANDKKKPGTGVTVGLSAAAAGVCLAGIAILAMKRRNLK